MKTRDYEVNIRATVSIIDEGQPGGQLLDEARKIAQDATKDFVKVQGEVHDSEGNSAYF